MSTSRARITPANASCCSRRRHKRDRVAFGSLALARAGVDRHAVCGRKPRARAGGARAHCVFASSQRAEAGELVQGGQHVVGMLVDVDLRPTLTILPPPSMKRSTRHAFTFFLPSIFFSTITPKASQSFDSVSASSSNGIEYFFLKRWCDSAESRLTPTMRAFFRLKLRIEVAKLRGLARAARRIVFGVEIEDQRAAEQVGRR